MAGGAQDDDDGLISNINVTPLVDVTLVLLIIFIVTAKIIISQGMPMDLPQASSPDQLQVIFAVELTADGKTSVDKSEVKNDATLTALAKDAKAKNKDLRAVIRADKTVQHGRVIHVLDLLKRAGVAKIAFAVSPKAAVPVDEQEPEPNKP